MRRPLRNGALLAMLLSLVLALPGAEAESVIAAEDMNAWQAVGRVNRGGLDTASTCSGALIAPDLVLTAAHCVAGHFDPRTADPSDIWFVAGWHKGSFVAARQASAIRFAPDYRPGVRFPDSIPQDQALIVLDRPIPEVTPIPLADVPGGTTDLGFVAYANSHLHAPALTTGCLHLDRQPGALYLGCRVVSGNSGGPVLDGLPGAPRLVAVLVARADGGAFASIPGAWVRDLVERDRAE